MTRFPNIPKQRLSLAREDGMAMIMAMIVTVVLLTLVGGAVGVSVQGSGATTRDDNSKAADEAVEAGLRVATYRLNEIQPSDSTCINNNAAVTPSGDGTCHDTTETLGNGATFTYFTTPALASGSSCVGYYVSSSAGLSQRCITVSATSNSVTRRAQIRAVSYSATPLFPVAGLTGLVQIDLSNNGSVNGSAGTNGAFNISNNATVTNNGSNAVLLGPSGSVNASNNGTYPMPALKRTPAQGPFTLSPVDPGNSATVNDDGRITNFFSHTAPSDPSTGCTQGTTAGSCWNPAARTLNLTNNGTLTLTGGVYNFCSLELSNNAVITIANGARVAVFIDSASRSGSACPTTKIANGGGQGYAGYFDLSNNAVMSNPSHDPSAMVVYIYDNTGALNNGLTQLTEANNGAFYGSIYAPQSWLNLQNNALVTGAVAANRLTLGNNFQFKWGSQDSGLQARSSGVYFRSAWRECQPTQTNVNDPQSGC